MASFSTHAHALAMVVRTILNLMPMHYVRRRLNGPLQSLLVQLASIQTGVDRCGIRATRLIVLERLAQAIGWDQAAPSTSAICRALRKLTVAMLDPVIELAIAEVVKAFGHRSLVHGRLAVAIDGVRINSPRTPVLAHWLHRPKLGDDKRAHQPQALVVTAVCVVTRVQLAQEILCCDGSERAGLRRMVRRLQAMGPMIVLLDRGYPARDLIGLLLDHGISFIVRLTGGKHAWREIAALKLRPQAYEQVDVRVRGANGAFRQARLRVIVSPSAKRGRPRCNRTPKQMVLLTNLITWKSGSIIALYHRRWDIETVFRENKRLLGATHFRARGVEGFRVELLAYAIYRLLMALTVAAASADAPMPRWCNPHAVRHSTPQTIVVAWSILVIAFHRQDKDVQRLAMLLKEMQRDRAKRRPGRTFKRICKGAEGRWKARNESWRD